MKKLIAVLAVLGVFPSGALALLSQSVNVSPSRTRPGGRVTIYGAVDPRCRIGARGDAAIIYSRAFAGATRSTFSGIPSLSVPLAKNKTRTFSIKITLRGTVKTGTYRIIGRCGPGNFGSTRLKVVWTA